ncbi:tRNA nucleotidyltransferase (CCA-adding enzyme) [Anaerobacterium chartisolvens]|uniref:tRNA nucleotidyltransferase (CCA-adding enzyme) n=1 Tax=Anaerobacterium chartisolvens TaxID=1297424 RepID=A0A369BA60_9FIRM|nr:HD domain-containing protein [Anaerobacterium chartisolvens]RCX18410.1 tRNA nucleotidyltransferase (CCA-adding enzyme) [Anaerobacterium chartisolvens]
MDNAAGSKLKIHIPPLPLRAIEALNSEGFEAYAVGGCVRDSLIGISPNDWDIATGAEPEQVKKLFKRTVDTGLKHGTVTVLLDNESFEITTFRIDGEYRDNRKPEEVRFTRSLKEDLSRRDFTANAIAYHPFHGLIDPFGGVSDIQKRIIRAVGNAEKRFNEDALRILRAVRFSAQLGFEIDKKTLEGIKATSFLLSNISSERIRDELTRLLLSNNPMKFSLLNDTGILSHVLPELEPCFATDQRHPYHIYNVALHSLTAVKNIEATPVLRWTMLLHDTGKPHTKTTDKKGTDHFYGHHHKSTEIANAVLKRLKFDNKTIDTVCRLVKNHDRQIEPQPTAVRRAVCSIGEDIFELLLKVRAADIKAQNPAFLPDRLEKLGKIRNIYMEIKAMGQCLSTRELSINGDDLIASGFRQGKEIGGILKNLLKEVVNNPELNQRETLLEMALKAQRRKPR